MADPGNKHPHDAAAAHGNSQDDVVVREGDGAEGAKGVERLVRCARRRVDAGLIEAPSARDAVARRSVFPTCESDRLQAAIRHRRAWACARQRRCFRHQRHISPRRLAQGPLGSQLPRRRHIHAWRSCTSRLSRASVRGKRAHGHGWRWRAR